MENKSYLYPLFSDPVLATKVDVDNNKILNYLKKLKYKAVYAEGCNQSVSNNLFKNKELKKEKLIFLNSVKFYLKRILHYGGDFKVINSWATLTCKKAQSQIHCHRNSWMSAVYYPEEDEHFSISFQRTNVSYIDVEYVDQDSIYSCDSFKIRPQMNSLLIFPSYLLHEIDKNKSNKNRYSLSFNINPIGHFHKGKDTEIVYD